MLLCCVDEATRGPRTPWSSARKWAQRVDRSVMRASKDITVIIRKHRRRRFFERLKIGIGAVPYLGPSLRHLKSTNFPRRSAAFKTSAQYWEDLYASGGNSGSGSYNRSARYKATVLNAFVQNHNIGTVLEWGC